MYKSLLFVTILVAYSAAHSMMQCLDYDMTTRTCKAAIRDSGVAKTSQSYRFNQNANQPCQAAFKAPISSYYSGGSSCGYAPCPDPMGRISPGSKFNVMWFARNHAVDNQRPGNVVLYLSPRITGSSDPSGDTFKQHKFCEGSYINCPDGNGDANQCYLECTMPNVEAGDYTVWWYWDWTVNDGNIYTTCADVSVMSSAGSTTGPQTATTGPQTATTGPQTATTGPQSGTTGPQSGTTGPQAGTTGLQTSTTGPISGGSASLSFNSIEKIPLSGSFEVRMNVIANSQLLLRVRIIDPVTNLNLGQGEKTIVSNVLSFVDVQLTLNLQAGKQYTIVGYLINGNGDAVATVSQNVVTDGQQQSPEQNTDNSSASALCVSTVAAASALALLL